MCNRGASPSRRVAMPAACPPPKSAWSGLRYLARRHPRSGNSPGPSPARPVAAGRVPTAYRMVGPSGNSGRRAATRKASAERQVTHCCLSQVALWGPDRGTSCPSQPLFPGNREAMDRRTPIPIAMDPTKGRRMFRRINPTPRPISIAPPRVKRERRLRYRGVMFRAIPDDAEALWPTTG
jgi:hypothetical protein